MEGRNKEPDQNDEKVSSGGSDREEDPSSPPSASNDLHPEEDQNLKASGNNDVVSSSTTEAQELSTVQAGADVETLIESLPVPESGNGTTPKKRVTRGDSNIFKPRIKFEDVRRECYELERKNRKPKNTREASIVIPLSEGALTSFPPTIVGVGGGATFSSNNGSSKRKQRIQAIVDEAVVKVGQEFSKYGLLLKRKLDEAEAKIKEQREIIKALKEKAVKKYAELDEPPNQTSCPSTDEDMDVPRQGTSQSFIRMRRQSPGKWIPPRSASQPQATVGDKGTDADSSFPKATTASSLSRPSSMNTKKGAGKGKGGTSLESGKLDLKCRYCPKRFSNRLLRQIHEHEDCLENKGSKAFLRKQEEEEIEEFSSD